MNQAQEIPAKKRVARGSISGTRSGQAVPVTISSQAAAARAVKPMPRQAAALPMLNSESRRQKKKGNKVTTFLVVLSIIAFVLLAAFLFISNEMKTTLDVDTLYSGVVFESEDFGGKTKEDLAAFAADQQKVMAEEVLFNIVFGEKEPIAVKLKDLNPTYNTEEAVEEAYQYGRDGSRLDRYIKVKNLLSEPMEFSIDFSVNESDVEKIVEKAAEAFNQKMSNAAVEFTPNEDTMFTAKGGKTGVEIDQGKLKTDITAALDARSNADIPVSAQEVEPEISADEAMANTQLIAQFSTTTTGAANRDTNIKLAAAAINGTVLQPGETFSTNKTTGQRTKAKGYKAAGAISGGKMIEDIGGGVCQVSSTLYGAVIRADLEIVSRSPHSWRSTYVPIGQDAAIDWPNLDFKFKNNTDAPIYLRATKVGTKLTMYIYGTPLEWEKIEVVSWSTGSLYPAATKTIVDKSLAPGAKVVERSSRIGETAVAYRVYYKDGKEHHRSKLPDTRHEPIQGIVKVGPKAAASTPE